MKCHFYLIILNSVDIYLATDIILTVSHSFLCKLPHNLSENLIISALYFTKLLIPCTIALLPVLLFAPYALTITYGNMLKEGIVNLLKNVG